METIENALLEQNIEIQRGVSARRLSTFGSGGLVEHLVLPKDAAQLSHALTLFTGTRYHVLGGGSNTLISDFGLQWVVGLRHLDAIEREGDTVCVGAGVLLPALAKYAQAQGLAGVEFASGIPAMVGGALRMNAGAYGQDMAAVVEAACIVTAKEGAHWVGKEQLQLRYRSSALGGVVAAVRLRLTPDDPIKIASRMEDMRISRAKRQPHQPSLGCVFKAVKGVPAAKYIEGCGLKGVRIGQAQVSGVHCNFIVNMGAATSRDYLRLADKIKGAVYERYGLMLEEEFVHMHD